MLQPFGYFEHLTGLLLRAYEDEVAVGKLVLAGVLRVVDDVFGVFFQGLLLGDGEQVRGGKSYRRGFSQFAKLFELFMPLNFVGLDVVRRHFLAVFELFAAFDFSAGFQRRGVA